MGGAYGRAIYTAFDRGLTLLRDDHYRGECLKAMGMPPKAGIRIVDTLGKHRPLLPEE